VSIVDVYRALWHHKLLIGVLTSCLVAATWYVTRGEQKTYEASTLVRVEQTVANPNDVYGSLQTGGLLAQTYTEIVGTTTIAHTIATDLKGAVPYGQIEGNISAHQIQDLDLLSVDVTSTDPVVAAKIANAAPGALREFVRRTASQGDQIITVQGASTPSSPVSPSLKLNLAIAILVGLLLNGALALLLEIVRDRVSDLDEFEEIAGAPVLGMVPNLSFVESGRDAWATVRVDVEELGIRSAIGR
jgi:protein tyrosine kinase modulator